MVVSGIFTFAFSIAVLFSIGDLNTVLSTPTSFPIIEIFKTATQSNRATNAMTAALISSLLFSNFGLIASASRLTWAFARDKGLPFSPYLAHVSHAFRKCPRNGNCLQYLQITDSLFGLGGQEVPYPCPNSRFSSLRDVPPWLHQHRINNCIQCHDFSYRGRPIHLLSPLDHPITHAKVQRQAHSIGAFPNRISLRHHSQYVQYGILDHDHCLQCLSPVSACDSVKHELRKPGVRHRNLDQRGVMVHLWKKTVSWARSGSR